MNTETFNKLLDELDGNSLETLKTKNAKYASTDDCLHNFESGAEIMGSTPAQCAWGYLTKHLVALRDKVQRDDFSDRDDFLEKCQDIINYIRFIWVIGNDREAANTMDEIVEDLKTPADVYSCETCGYFKGGTHSVQCETCCASYDTKTGHTSVPSNFVKNNYNIGYLGEALDK